MTRIGFKGQLSTIDSYEDDRQRLLEAGVDTVFNFYTEVGVGFAEESLQLIDNSETKIKTS